MNTQKQVEKSGIRLMTLVHNHLTDILKREKGNDKFIHLYSTGAYWVAFEQSACQLNRLYPRCDFFLFQVKGRPDHVVMTSICQEDASSYFQKHIVHRNEPDYKMLMTTQLPAGEFHRWHIRAVREVL